MHMMVLTLAIEHKCTSIELFPKLIFLFKIKVKSETAVNVYHPQMGGLVDRLIQTLKWILHWVILWLLIPRASGRHPLSLGTGSRSPALSMYRTRESG